MSKKVIIASDSTCDLSPELIEKYGIKILPLSVRLGENDYKDGVDVTPDDIYEHYRKTGELPKTAAVNVSDFADFFESATEAGSEVVVFTISALMSSTYNNARLASEDFNGVYAVDTKNLSTGGGLLVLKAADMAAEGYTAEDIAKACEALTDKVDASFVIDDLEFLYKGGRCSALEKFGANLLKLKPCITVKDAKMGVGKKYRGNFADVLPKYVEDRIGDGSEIEKGRVFVTHAGCDMNVVNGCVEQVKAVGFEEVLITRAGCTISSHCGQNTLGVLFLRK